MFSKNTIHNSSSKGYGPDHGVDRQKVAKQMQKKPKGIKITENMISLLLMVLLRGFLQV